MKKKYLICISIILFTSLAIFAGPIDNCYRDNTDLKSASLCADKVLARKIRRLSNGAQGVESVTVHIYRDSNCKTASVHGVRLSTRQNPEQIDNACKSILNIPNIYYSSMGIQFSDGFINCTPGRYARHSDKTLNFCKNAL